MVLPVPLGPSIHKTSPLSMEKQMFSNISSSSYENEMFLSNSSKQKLIEGEKIWTLT